MFGGVEKFQDRADMPTKMHLSQIYILGLYWQLGWGRNGGLRDSFIGVATRYVLDVPGSESRWGREFPHPS